jgi:alpha-D-ribose 1-methylphosphonate 5-triphosphate diphosphatase
MNTATINTVTLRNAKLVLENEVVKGSIRFVEGIITDIATNEIASGPAQGTIDVEGAYVLPGLVEIHTDALEWHLRPRPQSLWPAAAAVIGHDAVLAASGITTVLDSLCVGDLGGDGFRADTLIAALDAITYAQISGQFRIDHYLHYRCEVADSRTPGLFDDLCDNPLLRLVSLMDHTPGGRQYTDLDKYVHSARAHGDAAVSDIEAKIARLQQRQAEYAMPNWSRIAKQTVEAGLPLASHDDATVDDVALAVRSGVNISEFPTTELAADAAKNAGMVTAAGAPNIVRGGSHSGNVAAADLAKAGLLDIITSDYVPYSLLHAPFVLACNGVLPLHEAIKLVTTNPAQSVRLHDRGTLAIGMRADVLSVQVAEGVPLVRSVYSAGRRVA